MVAKAKYGSSRDWLLKRMESRDFFFLANGTVQ